MEREGTDRASAAPLTVARIPALVREVDVIVQTLAASRLPTDPHDIVELCESVLSRIEEIDAFRKTLRPGPLEAIVQKQSDRLTRVLESLHPDSAHAEAPVSQPSQPKQPVVLVDTKRRRQITPVHGSLLIKRTPSFHIAPGSATKQRSVRLPRHPKPIYKWEKRRHLHITLAHGSPYGRNELMDDDVTEASMELKPCTEPGHYVRSSMGFPLRPDGPRSSFELQLILTEAEVQALKFQRRQLQAEQRHLQRQQARA